MTEFRGVVRVRRAELDDPRDQQAVLDLVDMYAREPMGGGAPLSDEVRARLVPGLRRQANGRVFLAELGEAAVGVAICFLGFSSFRARPLINIHDLAVIPACRGRGVGRRLLEAVEEEARREGCCRITLEVRADNHVARALYRRFGFADGDPRSDALGFWKKELE
jgi:ribosomal protein S18 acetylase RimI-like enzyme